ncbi:MAG: hypothetical protein U9R50_06905 [Campylobacterota bacterium]|nr:hypothetical protein [Campylobacterota bacterium]
MGQKALEKKKAKEMQKAIATLQDELGKEIMEIFQTAKKPLDLAEIIALYPENARRADNDAANLKRYIQMGLGPMVQNGVLKQLPIDTEGKHRLELV